jgi:hypothetical protein
MVINNNIYISHPYIFTKEKTRLYTGVSFDLLTKDVLKLLDDKIKSFHNNLKFDAEFSEIVGIITGYDLIYNEREDCGGYCDFIRKKIAYNDGGGIKTILHEISHALQADLGLFESNYVLLSERVLIEQQAETMAYYLFNSIYNMDCKDFTNYFSFDDIKFLHNWYSGYHKYQNDIF